MKSRDGGDFAPDPVAQLVHRLHLVGEILLPDFDAGRTLYFDKDASSVSCLKEDMLELAQAAKIYHEMGYNKAEISQALNLPFGGKVKNNGAKK